MPDAPPAVGVVGLGRLGRAVADACAAQRVPVVLTATRDGWDAERVPAVIVDTSSRDAHDTVRDYCLRHRVALVECVSDLTPGQWDALEELARRVPVVRATNLTVGHYAQSRMTEWLTALRLDAVPPPETSVAERHSAAKAHRPSATAVELARVCGAAGGPVTEVSSRRAGPPVSDHEVMWAWPHEVLTLAHSVRDLRAAAAGALTAARWACAAGPGLTGMRRVYDELTDTPKER